MPLSERAWRFRLHRWLRRVNWQDYVKRIDEMACDPLAMSSDYLAKLLTFVSDHNEYYARFPSDGNLESMPILTKEIIRQHFDALRSTPQGHRVHRNSSGGSTGRPVTLIQDANYGSWQNATRGFYFREFLGVDLNTVKQVWLWGSERDSLRLRAHRIQTRVAMWLTSTVFLNTFDTDDRTWLDYIEIIRRYRPHFVAGYAGSLYLIARVARQYNIRLYQPAFVYSSAEMLRDFMREEIEEQFNAKVYDYYGSREVGAIAGECAYGNKHIFAMNNIVEVLDDRHQTAIDDSEGRLIVTNLHNYSMPLIRYDIGDTGVLSSLECACGSALPVLKRLTGRITDHFILSNGTRVHGEFITHLFYFRDWVGQFQVDQLDYERFKIRVVPCGLVDENDVEEISRAIRFVMGSNCRLDWEYVDSIDKSRQGKHLFTRCTIPND